MTHRDDAERRSAALRAAPRSLLALVALAFYVGVHR